MTRRLAALLAAVPLSLAWAVPASAPAATAHSWIENAWTTHLLDQSFPVNAGYFYNRPGSYGSGADTGANPVMDGFATTPVLRYTSYAQFSADIASGVIPNAAWPAGSWVEYDNEQWSLTPLAEQQSPTVYMPLFNQAAHAAGFKVFDTPARDLGNVATDCPKRPGEDNNGWYLRCDIARYAVTGGDGVVVQDQAKTLNATTYQALFSGAWSDAQAGNSAAWADSELSDAYGTPAQAFTAGNKLNRADCGGFFIHVANADVAWENTVLSSFRSAGW